MTDDLKARAFAGEKRAMLLDRDAVLRVISALRAYREASERLLAARYADGECDAVALSVFEDACREAEESAWGSPDEDP